MLSDVPRAVQERREKTKRCEGEVGGGVYVHSKHAEPGDCTEANLNAPWGQREKQRKSRREKRRRPRRMTGERV